MWVEHASPLALLQLLRETMENMQARGNTPSPDKVSSAADAMLKLSSSGMLDPVTAHRLNTTHAQMQMVGQLSDIATSQGNRLAAVPPPNGGRIPVTSPVHEMCQGPSQPYLGTDEESQSSFSVRQARKERKFIPEDNKDESYWSKRRKNNEAAKRSREKRRLNDMVLNQRIAELHNANSRLQMEMNSMKHRLGWPIDKQFPIEGKVPSIKPMEYLSNSDSESSNTSFTSDSLISGTYLSGNPSAAGHMPHDNNLNIGPAAEILKSPNSQSVKRVQAPLQPHSEHEIDASVPQQMPMLLPLVQAHVPNLIPSAIPGFLPRTAMEGGASRLHQGRNTQEMDSDIPPPPLHLYPDGVRLPVPSHFSLSPENSTNGLRRQPMSPGRSSSGSSPELKINLSHSSSESESISRNARANSLQDAMAMRYNSQTGDSHYFGDLAKVVESNRGSGRKGVPFKLWHKISNSESQREGRENEDLDDDSRSLADNAQDLVSSTSQDSGCVTGKANQYLDPRYLERRRRNNQAARKCRENRKMLNDVRWQKASILENENDRLRTEMKDLSEEIVQLRELLEKKKQAQAKGESFELPPIEHNQHVKEELSLDATSTKVDASPPQ